MNSPKVTDEDHISFISVTLRDAGSKRSRLRSAREQKRSGARRFYPASQQLKPNTKTLWMEVRTQINLTSGILVLDDSTLEKPYSGLNTLVYRCWSGKQKKSLTV